MCDSPFMRQRLETWRIWAGSGAQPPFMTDSATLDPMPAHRVWRL